VQNVVYHTKWRKLIKALDSSDKYKKRVPLLLQLANIQATYHRQSLSLLEGILPALTEEIGNYTTSICYSSEPQIILRISAYFCK